MSADAYGNFVYDKLYSLLEAYSGFTSLVKPGNELKTPTQRLLKYKQSQIADTPTFLLDLVETTEALYPPTEDYTYNSAIDPGLLAWIESWTYTYQVTITHSSTDVKQANTLCAQVTTALRQGGPQLGLQYVRRWGPLRRRDSTPPPGADAAAVGTFRRVSRIYVPVEFEFNGQSLLDE